MVIEGRLHAVLDTIQATDTFKRRTFVVEYIYNPLYPQYVSFELTQDRVSLIDKFPVGTQVEVTFNLRGREWTSPQGEKKYFNTLEAWRVQKVGEGDGATASAPVYDMADISSDQADSLPF